MTLEVPVPVVPSMPPSQEAAVARTLLFLACFLLGVGVGVIASPLVPFRLGAAAVEGAEVINQIQGDERPRRRPRLNPMPWYGEAE